LREGIETLLLLFKVWSAKNIFSIGQRVPLGEIIRQGIKPPEELIEGILLG